MCGRIGEMFDIKTQTEKKRSQLQFLFNFMSATLNLPTVISFSLCNLIVCVFIKLINT